jgi:hypothetical protein
MADTSPRVEVDMKACKTCYLSNDPPLYIVVHVDVYDSEGSTTFLQDGYAGVEGYQPINSKPCHSVL